MYKENIDFHENLLREFGPTPQGVGWSSKQSQVRRFKALTEIADLRRSRVLDVGCGVGHFSEFLQDCFYAGIDISPRMIKAARGLYGERFYVASIQEIKPKFGWVFANGTFNLKIEDNDRLIKESIEAMFGRCIHGVGITMTSALSRKQDNLTYYYEPRIIIEIASGLTQRWGLRHDYLPHDMCLYLYKEEKQ